MTPQVSVKVMWRMCQTQPLKQVAERYGRTPRKLVEEFRQSGLYGNGKGDPSPAQIREQCKLIREGWDEPTRMNRWAGRRKGALVL